MALGEGEIVITIRDAGSLESPAKEKTGIGASERLNNFNDPLGTRKDKNLKANDYLSHKANDVLKQEVMMIVNNMVGTIGTRTGNYVVQQNTQQAVSIAKDVIGIGMGAMAGLKYGKSPYGALIGATLVAGAKITNRAITTMNYERQIRIHNKEIGMLRERAGFGINNNSR